MTRRSKPAGTEAFELSFHYFREHRAYMKRLLGPFDLTPMQMHALRALEGGPLTMAALSELIFCEPPNVTPVADKLEARGLVHRLADASDRRIKRVALTDAGERMRRELSRALSEPPPLVAALSEADQRALRDLFRKIVAGIDRPAQDA